ncbi:hypothetical protein [Streptomyces sp. NBC_01408]|uniref:hypothetical protein n=1 Tax=Streptomyces sp. NBC_01408 TaxID=2903855 RepID=UPI002257C6E6|nr:hypothetical protein [Streptomyces sp. NBC_01408]MCX4692717.1 hypothetical protein [Streptomyces sp. NBC_01408]
MDLSRLQLRVETSSAHPEGICVREHVLCRGCRLKAHISIKFGGAMAYCRICCFAWAVDHDPLRCWQNVAPLSSLRPSVLF